MYKRKHWFRLSALLTLTVIIMAGCWDRKEINDLAFVIGNSFDKVEGGYRQAVQFPIPSQISGLSGGGGGSKGGKQYAVKASSGKTIGEAHSTLQRSLPRRLNYSHRRVLLLGEELVKEDVAPILDVVTRVPQNRLTTLIAATEGSAEDVLNQNTDLENLSVEHIREIIIAVFRNPITIDSFLYKQLEPGVDSVLPVVGVLKGKPGLEGKGIGIFKKDKMVKVMKGDDATALLFALNQTNNQYLNIDIAGNKMVILFLSSTAKYSIDYKSSLPRVRIDIEGDGSMVENLTKIELDQPESVHQLEYRVQVQVAKMIEKLIPELQKAGSDPLGIGNKIYSDKPGLWKRLEKDWEEIYADLQFEINVKFHLENTGSIIKSTESVIDGG